MVLQTVILQDEREKNFSLFAAVLSCCHCVYILRSADRQKLHQAQRSVSGSFPRLKQCLFYTSHTVFMPRLRTCTILQSDSDVLSHRIKGGGGKVL